MLVKINSATITLLRGDITDESTDAIVNAANSRLAGGAGVDGAIHGKGGPAIMEECAKITNGCPAGSAVITTGGRLKARFVIHTVGPIYRGGKHNEATLLASAYRSSLALALEHNLKSISFPSISTGAYGYPIDEACAIAITTTIEFLRSHKGLETVRFVLFSDADLKTYEIKLEALADNEQS